MGTNNITGDSQSSKAATDSYRDNYDRIFKKPDAQYRLDEEFNDELETTVYQAEDAAFQQSADKAATSGKIRVVISGAPGSGKSTVMQVIAAALSSHGLVAKWPTYHEHQPRDLESLVLCLDSIIDAGTEVELVEEYGNRKA